MYWFTRVAHKLLSPAYLPRSYVVPLVFFHFCRKWTTTRDDICTNDNRGIVALGASPLACCVMNCASLGDGQLVQHEAAASPFLLLWKTGWLVCGLLIALCVYLSVQAPSADWCQPVHHPVLLLNPSSAGPSLPMAAVPSHSRGASLVDAAMAAAANGNGYADSGSKFGLDGSQGEEAVGAAGTLGGGGASWQQRPGSAAAALGTAGSGPAEVRLDVEMAARVSSAPILDEAERPPSPVKQAAQAAQQAWSTISGLPRRMAGGGPAHRRTESQEPVLLMEDKSTGSV